MKREQMKRDKMTRLAAAVTLTLACHAAAELLPVATNAGAIDTYVYVPKGQRFTNAQLSFTAHTEGSARVRAYLDGRFVAGATAADEARIKLKVPNIVSGFHHLSLNVAAPARLEAASEMVAASCAASSNAAFSASAVALRYAPRVMRAPRLSELPDGLYAQGIGRAAVGGIDADATDADAVTAVLRVAQALASARPLVFSAARDVPPDFVLSVRKDNSLGAAARLTLDWKKLTVRYGSAQALGWAVNALTDPAYRAQLGTNSVLLSAPVPPPAQATLPVPRSLSDYGVADLRVLAGSPVTTAVQIPAYWYTPESAKGTLAVVAPAQLGRNAHFWVWAQDEALISRDLSHLEGDRGAFVARLQGTRPLADNTLALQMQTQLSPGDTSPGDTPPGDTSSGNGCEADAEVWVDARRSKLDMQLLPKTGVGALAGLLLGAPTVAVSDLPGVALAATIAAGLPQAGLRGVLPLRADRVATLSIMVGEDRAARVAPSAGGATFRRSGDRVTVGATSVRALEGVTRQWPRLQASLPGGWSAAFADTSGQWVAPTRGEPQTRVLARSYGGWGALAAGVLLLGVLLTLLPRRARARK